MFSMNEAEKLLRILLLRQPQAGVHLFSYERGREATENITSPGSHRIHGGVLTPPPRCLNIQQGPIRVLRCLDHWISPPCYYKTDLRSSNLHSPPSSTKQWPPFVILSRSAHRHAVHSLRFNTMAVGNVTLERLQPIDIPDAQRVRVDVTAWVLNPAPPSITPVIPVLAADRQAAQGGAVAPLLKCFKRSIPSSGQSTFLVPLTYSELHFLNIPAFKGPMALPGVQEPRSPAWTSLLEPKAPTPRDRHGMWWRLGSTHPPECAVSKYVAS
ncbi:hypothetical protein BS47DRAFT_1369657 [Hydnum rufescens UP504]|uniref:Uncharacterized protein n=1 Tax=Hydnum rufescens UP504 TaxID=1448309 RepID=A0A9P6AC58_9AGAM|nr:hypothetical protein BS47DRAFT_1369657 [Hydnum rufescens UP504]